jgi:hypothetical protein
MKKVAEMGSVSHGTMREEDLIPTFLEKLKELDPQRAQTLKEECDKLELEQPAGYGQSYYTEESKEDASWVLIELFDALQECAPEDYYFGSHPGDGADYGFWQEGDEEEEEEY